MAKLFHLPQAVRIDSAGTPYAGALANFYLTGTTTRTDTYTDNALSVAHANPVVADAAGQFPPVFLDPAITYRCIITESDATGISDTDPIQVPITAADVALVDAAGGYAATNVETALAEVVTDNVQKAGGTMTGDLTMSGADINLADNLLTRPEIKDYAVTHTAPTASSGTLTIDCTLGNSFYHELTADVTTLTLQNAPDTGNYGEVTLFLQQDGTGAHTVAASVWNSAAVKWPGGTDPTISPGASAIDIITLSTIDGGTTWYGNFSQAYS